MTALWDSAPSSHIAVDRRFRGAYYRHHLSDISLLMEAVGISETSVSFYENTRRSVPESCHLYTPSRETDISQIQGYRKVSPQW
jgi:hypothetical protein